MIGSINMNNIVFFPFRGYGTIIEIFLSKVLINKDYILRDFPSRTTLSEIGKSPYKNDKEIYLEVDSYLDHFYNKVDSKENYYQGINIPKIFRRDLHTHLSEFFNKLYQLREYQTQKNTIYKAEYKLYKILKDQNINCNISFLLTFIYTILDFSFIIYVKIKQKITKTDINSNIYINKQRKGARKTLLAVGVTKDRINKTFLNLFNNIKNEFNVTYIQPENNIESSELLNYDKEVLNIKSIINIKAYSVGHLKSDDKLELFIADYLSYILKIHTKKAIEFINILNKVNEQIKIDGIITGLTFYWMYDICVQFSQINNIKSIFFQDVFLYEDLFFNISSDYILTASYLFNNDSIKYFNKDKNKLFISKDINSFLTKSPLDLHIKNTKEIEYIKLSMGNKLNILDRKVILFASDPGNTMNSLDQKYIDEFNLLNTLSNLDEYFIIIKLHPSDNTGISKKALRDSRNKNAIVVKDIDFYDCLYCCDIFVSKYSTSVLEAMLLNKFILLNNYDKAFFYKKAVDYKVAHYINKIEDIKMHINSKDKYMLNFEEKRKEYFDKVHVDSSDNKNIVEILKEVIND
jgi:hypothetical protein